MRDNGAGRRRFPVFWVLFAVFAAAFVYLWVWVVGYVRDCMVTYEEAQPDAVMESRIMGEIEGILTDEEAFSSMGIPVSRFEEGDAAFLTFEEDLGDLTFEAVTGGYDAMTPAYTIISDGTPVATATLRESSSRTLMLMLTLQEWELDTLTPMLETLEPYVITVPSNYTVAVNGVTLGAADRTDTAPVSFTQLQYAAAYVDVPELVEYKVEGLYKEPSIEIVSNLGETVEPVGEAHSLRVEGYTATQMSGELEELVLQNAKDYSNFFSRDLAGCTRSIDPIRHLFPSDSVYLELAEIYRREDMSFYSAHGTPTFSDEAVSNYVVYTDELFSCDVYFDKKLILTRTGGERHDITNTRYYYVSLDGSWVIADMQQILSDGTTG